ncbi:MULTISPECIES: aldehyde dehydrogenase family protein [unclassified Modestobacter]|uniref:aldehyde dehydrogenase family protein n=1 Tax=unclassified Modestobacter TaxID=2643866 RepID=UPI0022AB27BD|nr:MULTISPECIES: aldehyde dehydrogenase family protein [unclassified Modestobacter]MCZ2825751.1 aldehyde dehydrogenase family protein [Modestobacter sp. VKM Ac-2981]MCZ2853184.1 aldehyde dehydrogenase family protein [Modestobacter sp. VKM Ac-2982]
MDVADAGPVEDAVAAARRAFPGWSTTPAADRQARLRALRQVVLDRAEEIVATVRAETGRHPADIAVAEVLHAAAHLDWLARHAAGALAGRRTTVWPLVHKRTEVHARPRGVAAVLAPWNYPFLLALLPATTALAAGCTVVLKPSEHTPDAARLLERLVTEAGFPPDVLRVVPGGAEVGELLVTADVDVVSVTGSAATGRRVAALAADRLTPVVAELGGTDAMIVLADADLRRAARAAAWGACFNAGQSCVSIERLYVVAAVHDRFLAELERAFDDLTVGGGGRRDIGPMVLPATLATVQRQVREAVAAGARVHRGGRRVRVGSRDHLEPTLLSAVRQGSDLVQQETFGPVLPVLSVPDEETAVRLANDSAYGLQASVWTADRARGRSLAGRLRVGAVAVNDCLVNYAAPGLPFGGRGASGTGRQGGVEGLRAYCYTQTLTDSRLRPPRELQWFPRIGGAGTWIRVARLLYGRPRRAPRAPSGPAPQRP